MKKILWIVTLLMSRSAMASASYFERLASFHTQGSRLTFKEFKGFYSGRCFSNYKPNDPIGSMLGYMKSSAEVEEVGPGLSHPIEYKISIIIDRSNAPGRYDDNYAANKKQFYQTTKPILINRSSYVESPTLSYTTDWEPNGNPDVRDELVTYGNYIINKSTALIAQDYGPHGIKKPGDVLTMCYFFKRLE